MQRKFVNTNQFAGGFGQSLVNQPRFSGQILQTSHRVAALLPDPITPPIRNQNFINRTKKTYNTNSNLSQPQLYNIPRSKIGTPNTDNRINHKYDIIRKPIQIRRQKIVNKSDNEATVSASPIQPDMPPNMVLLVTNYPPSCNEAALIMFFAKMEGFLQLFSHRTKKHMSFVIYNTIDQAKDALATYHGYQMDHEHKLQVTYANHEMAYCD